MVREEHYRLLQGWMERHLEIIKESSLCGGMVKPQKGAI